MFDNSEARNADRLGDLWDEVNRSGKGKAARDGNDAELARYLRQLAPSLNESTRDRMRARVLASQRAEARSMAQSIQLDASALSAPLPPQPKSLRTNRLDHPFMRIAALILLSLVIAATWLGIRSFSSPDPTPTPVQGAVLATPTGDEEVGFRETVLLYDVAPISQVREFTADLTRITLSPGGEYAMSGASFVADTNPIGFYVLSGTLQITSSGSKTDLGPEDAFNKGVPELVRNASNDNVTFIQIALVDDPGQLPVLPEMTFSVNLGKVPVKQPIGSVTTLNFSKSVWNMPGANPISTSSNETLAWVAVNSGTLTVHEPAGERLKLEPWGRPASMFEAASSNAVDVGPGYSLTADLESSISGTATWSGTDQFSAYLLTIQQQTPEDIAQSQIAGGSAINWEIPTGTESVSMMVRSVTLQPGAIWSYEFEGAVAFQTYSGRVSIQFGDGIFTGLAQGQYVAKSGSGNLVIQNVGTDVAQVFQASITPGNPVGMVFGGAPPEGVAMTMFGLGTTPVSPGEVTVRFSTQSIDGSSTQSTDSEIGGSLISVIEGNALVNSRTGGVSVTRVHNQGPSEASPTLPNAWPTLLLEGDSIMVQRGADYSITGTNEHVTRCLWFWFQPAETDATPTAGN